MFDEYYKYLDARKSETDTEFVTEVDFAGANKDNVSVKTEDELLVLTVNVRGKKWNVKLAYPWEQDFTGTKVKVENGVITIRVPKNLPTKREVKINVE